MTPEDVHYGRADKITKLRQITVNQAYMRSPERFAAKAPKASVLPEAVWINPPPLKHTGSPTDEYSNDGKLVSFEKEVLTN